MHLVDLTSHLKIAAAQTTSARTIQTFVVEPEEFALWPRTLSWKLVFSTMGSQRFEFSAPQAVSFQPLN